MKFSVPDAFAVVALDHHDGSTHFGILPPGEREAVEFDVCETQPAFILSRVRRLARKWPVVVLYEAGRMGYWLYRKLKDKEIHCIVIDPGSMLQKRHGENKSDRLDAAKMACHARSNVLVAVSVPDQETEGVRDLLHCRRSLSRAAGAAKNRITSLLARYHKRYTQGKTLFTHRYRRWLTQEVRLPTPDAQLALDQYCAQLVHTEAQLANVEKQLEEVADRPRYATIVKYLTAIHGVGPQVVLGFLTGLQTPHRFATAHNVMSYFGLTPGVCSSDGRIQKHPRITHRGDEMVRWLLVQGSWAYAREPRITHKKTELLASLPAWFQERVTQMEKRLRRRYRHLFYRKFKPRQQVVVAIAREMAGWLWALLKELERAELVSFAPAQEILPPQAA